MNDFTDERILTDNLFENSEVVALANRQAVYTITPEYGENGRLYLKSCVKQ